VVGSVAVVYAGSVVPVGTEVLGRQRSVAVASVAAVRRYDRGHWFGSPARKEGQNPRSSFEGILWEGRASPFSVVRYRRSDQTTEHSGGKEGGMDCLRAVGLAEDSLLGGRSSTRLLASTLTGMVR
jgi:hypothetical protein